MSAYPYARHPEVLEICIFYTLTPFNFFCQDVEELNLAIQVMKIAIIGDGRATIVIEDPAGD